MNTRAQPKICRIILLSCFICLIALTGAEGREWNYAPIALKKLSCMFPQTCIQTSVDKGKPFNAHGVEGIYKEDLLLSSTTKSGKKWSLKLCAITDSYSVWEADFDKNGEPDLAILTPTGGCGYACSDRILFIMFDKNRTPRVFVGFGFLLTDKAALKSAKAGVTDKGAPEIPRGIQDICKSDSGQAIIVLQSMEHDGEHNYWRTSAWTAKNSNWCEVHNIYGARLPSYVWFTSKPNHKPSPGKDYLGKDAASAIYEIHKTGELQKNEEFRIK